MKILHLSKFYPPFQGGMELFLYDLNEALHQHTDLQSDVLCFNEHQTNETDTAQGYLIQRAALTGVYSSMPISVSYLTWLLRNHHHYDILHIHVRCSFVNAPRPEYTSAFKQKIHLTRV